MAISVSACLYRSVAHAPHPSHGSLIRSLARFLAPSLPSLPSLHRRACGDGGERERAEGRESREKSRGKGEKEETMSSLWVLGDSCRLRMERGMWYTLAGRYNNSCLAQRKRLQHSMLDFGDDLSRSLRLHSRPKQSKPRLTAGECADVPRRSAHRRGRHA